MALILTIFAGILGGLPVRIPLAVLVVVVFALALHLRRPLALTLFASILVLVIISRLMEIGPEPKAVSDPPPYTYPVLVIANGRAYVSYWGELDAARKKYPDLSFLVPPGKPKVESESALGERLYSTDYNVTVEAPDRQLLDVSGGKDDDEENQSRYRVEGGKITPLEYQTSAGGPHFADGCLFMGILGVWFAITVAVMIYVHSRFVARPVEEHT